MKVWMLLGACMATSSLAQTAAPRTLAKMRDLYRPVVLFQPEKDEQLAEQLHLLSPHRSELIDRQIMLVLRPYAWAGPMDNGIMTFRSWEEDRELRRRFHIRPNDFTVILLGKDGGEKFRSHAPVTIDQLNRIIDAMPMRQQEMREHPR